MIKWMAMHGMVALLVGWLAGHGQLLAQPATPVIVSQGDTVSQKRLRWLTIGGGAAYGMTLLGLNQLWYTGHPRTGFHFFNDSGEWLQVDKIGHFYSAFHLSRIGGTAFRWTGLRQRKAMLLGSLTGIALMTPIEILDGFSSEYGASWSDEIANLSGSALFLGQQLWWNEIRLYPKFSFHRTPLAARRPNTLGNGLSEELLKDYNGQTYWLSVNIGAFLKPESHFPKWLNLAVGYGAQDMVFARPEENSLQGYRAYRQYYLSPDIDWSRIPTRHRGLRWLFFALNTVKLPLPALEWNRRHGFHAHAVYF